MRLNGESQTNKRLQRGWLVTKPANDGVVMYFAARNLLPSAAFDSKINNPMFGDVAGRRSYGKYQLLSRYPHAKETTMRRISGPMNMVPPNIGFRGDSFHKPPCRFRRRATGMSNSMPISCGWADWARHRTTFISEMIPENWFFKGAWAIISFLRVRWLRTPCTFGASIRSGRTEPQQVRFGPPIPLRWFLKRSPPWKTGKWSQSGNTDRTRKRWNSIFNAWK